MALQTYAKKYLPQPVVDVLRMVKYRLDLATFPKHVVTHRYGKYRFDMTINDRVASEWYDKDWTIPPEIDFLSQAPVPRGGRVFDLGAHQCLIAMLLGQEIAPEGSVVAVEANRHNAEIARLNIERNGIDNVDIVHAMVSSKAGKARAEMTFNSHAKSGISGIVSNVVDALSIDELSQIKGFPDLVYMDIEGYEIEALKGATLTLTRWCHWFVELHGDDILARYGAANTDILNYFDFQDFARYLCLPPDDKFRLVTEREPLPTARCFMIFAPRSARLINQDTQSGYASRQ